MGKHVFQFILLQLQFTRSISVAPTVSCLSLINLTVPLNIWLTVPAAVTEYARSYRGIKCRN